MDKLPDRDELILTEQQWLKMQQRLLERRILIIKRVVVAMLVAIVWGYFLTL